MSFWLFQSLILDEIYKMFNKYISRYVLFLLGLPTFIPLTLAIIYVEIPCRLSEFILKSYLVTA